MEGHRPKEKGGLYFDAAHSIEAGAHRAFALLANAVFGQEPAPSWPVWTICDRQGSCVAGLQTCVLTLRCGDIAHEFLAMRNVAVAADWRGRGLMRDLMDRVLRWCDQRAFPALLYAETPRLYDRFGFRKVEQHAFLGRAPKPEGGRTARPFDRVRDVALLSRLQATRQPLSNICAIVDDGGLCAEALSSMRWSAFYAGDLDALIVTEDEADTLVLVDVLAPRVPPAARLLGSLGVDPTRMRTLFSPDRLDWIGKATLDDAGLMVRGKLFADGVEPFMLPPTVEF